VNELWKQQFASGSRQLENIPPTKSALLQKANRTAFQAGHIWSQALLADPMIPSLENWGWFKEGSQWLPVWTTLPEASKACRALIKCGCKKSCKGNCKCKNQICHALSCVSALDSVLRKQCEYVDKHLCLESIRRHS
jgi:hypothetical protein